MSAIDRAMLRAAALVHQFLHRRRSAQGEIFLPDHAWQRAKAALARRDLARGRGWLRAMGHVNQDLIYELGYLRTQIDHVLNVLNRPDHLQPFPSQAEIYRDILALDEEFPEVRVDLKRGYSTAVTERI